MKTPQIIGIAALVKLARNKTSKSPKRASHSNKNNVLLASPPKSLRSSISNKTVYVMFESPPKRKK